MKPVHVKEIFSIDFRSAALYRMLLGMYVVFDAVNRISLTPTFYSDTGLFPRSAVPLEHFEHAVHFHGLFLSGSGWFAALFFTVMAIAGLCLFIGFKTRAATVLCWFLFCNAIVRDGLTTNSGDILLIQLLFWGMFLPLGRVFSLDSRIEDIQIRPKIHLHFLAASVGLYVQFVLIYITTGMFKGQYHSWLDGTHLYITFSRFEYMTPLAFLIYPWYDLLAFLTKLTLILELFGPLLFFIPFYFLFFRMTGILLFLGLQVSILLTMNVGFFPIASIAGIIVFLPTGFWKKVRKISYAKREEETGKEGIERHNDKFKKINNSPTQTAAVNLFLTTVIIYITAWNLSELPGRYSLSDTLKKPGYFLKLDQRWAMFSSTVFYAQYYSVPATYSDGTTTDLLKDLKKELNSSEEYHHIVFKNFRWRKFLAERIYSSKYIFLRPHLIDYLVREYGDEQKGRTIVKVDYVAHRHYIGNWYDHSEVEEIVLYSKEY